MKIILVHKFWRKVGGAEVYFQDVARILRQHGHEVRIFTTEYNAKGSTDVYDRTPEVYFGISPEYRKGSFIKKIGAIPESIYSKKNKKLFAALLDSFRPDLVHVFALYVSLTPSILDACKEAGVPVVMSCNDYKHICPNYRLFHHGKICNDCKGGSFYHALTNNCCKHSLAVSAVSALESYVHQFMNIYKKNVNAFLFESRFMMDKTAEFWPEGGYNMEFLGKPYNALLNEASPNYEDYLLFVGRLSDEKGVDILIQAMKQVPEARLRIAGDGPWRSYLEALCNQLQVNNVQFLGAVWGEATGKLISKSRFVVIPSIWYENFPYVMAESYSRGKAIIGSDRGGIPEYIRPGETGLVYPALEADKLAESIRKLWNDPENTVKMGLKGKEWADELFNDASFYSRLMAIYQKVSGELPEKSQI
ncbi:MAG TPA: glycosyltransferase [Bacteroidia bacterium]|nr:glycosyltransferase [Bacteroidia bacterium]